MNKSIYILGAIAIIAMILGIIAVASDKPCDVTELGGYTAGYWDCDGGYYVDGTAIIDGSGNVDGSITSDTGTFSSTLDVTGAATFGSTVTITGETAVGNFIGGGSVATIYGTTTLTAANLCDNSVFIVKTAKGAHKASAGMVTLTTPATTTLYADCLDSNGEWRELLVVNNATTAIDILFSAGAGIDYQRSGTSTDSVGIPDKGAGHLKLWRWSTATTSMNVEFFEDAD